MSDSLHQFGFLPDPVTQPDSSRDESPVGDHLRTSDTSYSAAYWDSLDNGAGYRDSVLWENLAHIVHEVFGIVHGEDRAGDFPIVDVGTAYGFMIKHLRRRGFDAWGLDFSHYALDHADEDVKPYLRWYDLTSGDDSHFGTDAFARLTCFETLEHIPADKADTAQNQLRRLLRPQGLALLTICVAGQPGWDTDPTHVNVVERAWWQNLFDERGWVTRHDMISKLQDYWLFSKHKGVFVLQRP